MEFMDRKQRSILVQFWLNVDTLKDPLESSDPLGSTPLGTPDASPSTTEDIKLIHDLYFAVPRGEDDSNRKVKPNLVIQAVSPRHVETIRVFLASESEADAEHPDSANILSSGRARQAVLLAQKQVEDAMGDDFEDFKRSDLWFRGANEYQSQKEDANGTASALLAPMNPDPFRKSPTPPALTPSPPIRPPDVNATPVRRPLIHAFTSPARRVASGNLRNHDTIRSRIFPTFILPSSSSEGPITSLSDEAPSLTVRKSSHTRPRVLSFGSDTGSVGAVSTSSSLASPMMSNSVDSLPPRPLTTGPSPSLDSKSYRNALDFLISDPTPAGTSIASAGARAPLFDDPEIIREETAQAERMEAIQAALTDIIADERKDGHSLFGSGDLGDERPSIANAPSAHSFSGSLGETGPTTLHIPPFPSRPYERAPSTPGEGEFEEESPIGTDGGHARASLVAAPGDLLLSHDIVPSYREA